MSPHSRMIFQRSQAHRPVQDIQGAEKVGEHVNSTTYWALWRLDKSVHKRNMEEFVEAATNQYEGFVEWPSDDPCWSIAIPYSLSMKPL